MTTNHSDRSHSIWSPSAWTRWGVHCPASALFTKDMPDTTSEYAERGTWMHERVDGELTGSGHTPEQLDNPYNTPANWKDIEFAVAYIEELISMASLFEEPTIMYEQQIALAPPYDDVFGTCDFWMWDKTDKTLYVVDYKFGHAEVEAEDNGQLMLYAVMAINQLRGMEKVPEGAYFDGVDYVHLTIIQPRGGRKIKSHRMTVSELGTWWNDTAKPAIRLAHHDGAPFNPHSDACKYCPANGKCPAQRQQAIKAFDEAQTEPATDEPDYAHDLKLAQKMEEWIKGVRSAAMSYLTKGGSIEGYKLVRGVTHRRWVDPEKAERWLASRGLKKDERTVTTIIGIPAAEEKIKGIIKDNPRLQSNFDKLIEQPEGRLTLAPDTDKRPAVVVENPFDNQEIKNEDYSI